MWDTKTKLAPTGNPIIYTNKQERQTLYMEGGKALKVLLSIKIHGNYVLQLKYKNMSRGLYDRNINGVCKILSLQGQILLNLLLELLLH